MTEIKNKYYTVFYYYQTLEAKLEFFQTKYIGRRHDGTTGEKYHKEPIWLFHYNKRFYANIKTL